MNSLQCDPMAWLGILKGNPFILRSKGGVVVAGDGHGMHVVEDELIIADGCYEASWRGGKYGLTWIGKAWHIGGLAPSLLGIRGHVLTGRLDTPSVALWLSTQMPGRVFRTGHICSALFGLRGRLPVVAYPHVPYEWTVTIAAGTRRAIMPSMPADGITSLGLLGLPPQDVLAHSSGQSLVL